ncbi:ImpA family type VI secretion system protein [Gemmobacter caeruleus]|uniref:type VI secretion system protein TssA n=1 Tax=Gemmobacter caeruleus TaxID=2595004 RepID=UPI0011EBEC3A|nr:type VI secretion system ImpA family N-terminal domain-containing protein [Gemmobacter caeruleus]
MDIEAFLQPLDSTHPSGSDLRNDARFHALENRLQPAGRAARLRAVENGGTGAVELDWSEMADEARVLAQSGRDLRLLVIVARLMTNEDGLAGLAGGLDLITRSVAGFWESLHPALRPSPSPREAALRRINALFQLENNDGGVLGDLEFVPLLAPRGLGVITGGDLAAAALTRQAFLAECPSGLNDKELADLATKHEARLNRVTAACRATTAERPDEMAALREATAAALAGIAALETALAPHVTDNGVAVKFDGLRKFLTRIATALNASDSTPQPEAAMTAAAPQTAAAAVPAAAMAPAIPGQINTRRDVEKCLDLIIDFYERTEPSSPIPHLARRMRKMVPMNFMQLMEEIAPSGLKEFRSVAGVFEDKSKAGRE